jgi:hemolysin III
VVWGLALIGMLQEIKPRSGADPVDRHLRGDGLDRAGGGQAAAAAWAPPASPGWRPAACSTPSASFLRLRQPPAPWHGIWHLFVIAGSLMHFVAVFFYVS